MLTACASVPRNPQNACEIFRENPDWYDAARDAAKKWGVPIQVQMAIIYQESRFVDDAKPPRKRFLGFIPTVRASSAYGYAQAKDETWDWYRKATGHGGADRDDMEDVVDFIGWYVDYSSKKLKISKWDARKQYLAYHEGHGGYARGTYKNKKWLLEVAQKVADQAWRYNKQLKSCEAEFNKGWSIWPF